MRVTRRRTLNNNRFPVQNYTRLFFRLFFSFALQEYICFEKLFTWLHHEFLGNWTKERRNLYDLSLDTKEKEKDRERFRLFTFRIIFRCAQFFTHINTAEQAREVEIKTYVYVLNVEQTQSSRVVAPLGPIKIPLIRFWIGCLFWLVCDFNRVWYV